MSAPLLVSGMRWGNVRLGVLSVTAPVGREDFSQDDAFIFSNICGAAARPSTTTWPWPRSSRPTWSSWRRW